MATYYARIRATFERATNSTYANADVHATEQTTTGTESATVYVDATATVTTTPFGDPKAVLIENLGTTAGTTVTAAWQNKAAAAQSQVIPIKGEGVAFCLTPDFKASANLTLTASAGSIPVKITFIG